MTHRDAVRVVLALRADDLVDLLLHQLVQHAEPDADAQRQQPLLRCPDQLAQRLLHPRGQHGLLTRARPARRDTVVSFTAVPPSIFGGSPRTLPTGADEAGGTAVSSSTSYGTTSASALGLPQGVGLPARGRLGGEPQEDPAAVARGRPTGAATQTQAATLGQLDDAGGEAAGASGPTTCGPWTSSSTPPSTAVC